MTRNGILLLAISLVVTTDAAGASDSCPLRACLRSQAMCTGAFDELASPNSSVDEPRIRSGIIQRWEARHQACYRDATALSQSLGKEALERSADAR